VNEAHRLSHGQGVQEALEFSDVFGDARVVGEAWVAVRQYMAEGVVEGGPDVGLVLLEHADKLGAGVILHGADPDVPSVTIHEDGSADEPVDIRQKLPGEVEAGRHAWIGGVWKGFRNRCVPDCRAVSGRSRGRSGDKAIQIPGLEPRNPFS
jgi:hypothetical protein